MTTAYLPSGFEQIAAQADEVRERVATSVRDVDAGAVPTSEILRDLGRRELLDLGVDSIDSPVAVSARIGGSASLIALLAEECMSSAFSLWAHRMVLDYFARGERTPLNEATVALLRTGDAIGSTAMASGLKALAGIEPLGVTGRLDGDELVVDGLIRWASNLVDGAVVVIPVLLDDERRIITWFRVGDPGVRVGYVDGLLALNATASASVVLEGVRIPRDAVLSWDFAETARAFRPTFLALQSSFCVGIARRSLEESAATVERSGNEGLRDRFDLVRREVEEVTERWRRLTDDLAAAPLVEFVRLRLDASLAAGEATRLEAALAGGRGYVASSGTARRFREAAFLPVQSPSEGQLRWELASLTS
ncbi:acyl-CoA dehydrogenase family protein [Cumulibacter manganitolerans]|uniref:acyl-CoA dehydrogenase family protein n=1 Tax=Cumulibacter manganitolerans TaxID=1884992 RepID=UPI0012977496|nr:acyl-CoA dehydrogenase family protein [Cumulibacter manganitolerans]